MNEVTQFSRIEYERIVAEATETAAKDKVENPFMLVSEALDKAGRTRLQSFALKAFHALHDAQHPPFMDAFKRVAGRLSNVVTVRVVIAGAPGADPRGPLEFVLPDSRVGAFEFTTKIPVEQFRAAQFREERKAALKKLEEQKNAERLAFNKKVAARADEIRRKAIGRGESEAEAEQQAKGYVAKALAERAMGKTHGREHRRDRRKQVERPRPRQRRAPDEGN